LRSNSTRKRPASTANSRTKPAPTCDASSTPPDKIDKTDKTGANATRKAEIALELDAKTPRLDRKLPDEIRAELRRFLDADR